MDRQLDMILNMMNPLALSPVCPPALRQDGGFAMVSWSDLKARGQLDRVDGKTLLGTTMMMVMVPLALWAAEVPVLTRDMDAGSVLSASDVTMGDVDDSRVFAGTVRETDDLVGRMITRNQKAGTPLAKIHVKEVPVVARDSMVSLTFKRPGVELVSSAKALQDGNVGETVRVLNAETRATLLATVVSAGAVEIR